MKRFTDLPIDVRKKIYKLAAKTDRELRIVTALPCNHPIGGTNKQIRSEFMPIFVELNRFGAPTEAISAVPEMRYANHVRDLHVWTKKGTGARMVKAEDTVAFGLGFAYPFSHHAIGMLPSMLKTYFKDAPRDTAAWGPRRLARMVEHIEQVFTDESARHMLDCMEHPLLCSFAITIRFLRADVFLRVDESDPIIQVFTNLGPVRSQ